MGTAVRQANFLLPEDLIEELRKTVSKRQQSKVVAEALRRELKRMKLEKVLETSFGAWEANNHPELEEGVDVYVRTVRKSTRMNRPR